MKTGIISTVTVLLYLLVIAAAAGVNVTILVNDSVSNYPAGVSNSSWTVLASSSTITSIDPTKIVAAQSTNATGYAVLNLSAGTYYISALNYNSTAQYATPLYMGTIMDSYTDLHQLNTSNETTGTINDYSNASAIRGYVKDRGGAGLNSGKVYFGGTYRGASIPSIPVTTRTSGGQNGYYAMFLPIENASTVYTVTATKSGYVSSSRDVNVTKGFGSSSTDFVNFTLSSVSRAGTGVLPVSPGEEVLLVANSIDSALASEFIASLEENDIVTTVINASQLTAAEKVENRLIIILGGPDAYEGVGGIVSEALSDAEEAAVREAGAQTMYVKYNLWTDRYSAKQKVIILAGSNRENTQAAETKYRSEVISELLT